MSTQPRLPNVPDGTRTDDGAPESTEANPAVLTRLPRTTIAVLDEIAAVMVVPRATVVRLALDAGLPIVIARFGLKLRTALPSATIGPDRRSAERQSQLELAATAAAKPATPPKSKRKAPAKPARASSKPGPKPKGGRKVARVPTKSGRAKPGPKPKKRG